MIPDTDCHGRKLLWFGNSFESKETYHKGSPFFPKYAV